MSLHFISAAATTRQLEVTVAGLSRIPPCRHCCHRAMAPEMEMDHELEERDSGKDDAEPSTWSIQQAAVSAGCGRVFSAGPACYALAWRTPLVARDFTRVQAVNYRLIQLVTG
jgi:hypothetical protein